MHPFHLTPLCAALALSLPLSAQAQTPAPPAAAERLLKQVTVIENGEEQIETTGGVVVTREDLEQLQPRDTAGIFARESGVQVSGGAQVAQRVYVLGFEQAMLAVTIDGARQPGTNWHHAGNILVDPGFLKRVEVEAGAAAADAGFAAAVGAVRYETVNAHDLLAPGSDLGARLKLGYGSNGAGITAHSGAYGKSASIDWLVMAARQNGSDFHDGAGHEVIGTAPKLTSGLAKLGLQQPQGHRYELTLEQNRDDALRTTRMNMDLAGGRPNTRYPLQLIRSTATLRYTSTQASDQYDPQVVLWYNQSDMERPNAVANANSTDFNLWEKAWGFKGQNSWRIRQGKLILGVDGSHRGADVQRYDNGVNAPKGHLREHDSQQGLYGQARLRQGAWGLSSGLRYDWHSLSTHDGVKSSSHGASANATLSYLLGEHAEAYVAASRTFQGFQWSQTGYYHARNYATAADYQASTAHNRKLGLNVFGSHWKAGIGYFDTRILQPTELQVLANNKGLRTNGARLRSHGWMLNAQLQWQRTLLGANATLAKASRGQPDVLEPDGGDLMPMGNTATLFAEQALPAWHARLGANIRYAARQSYSSAVLAAGFVEQPSYAVLGLSLDWNPAGRQDIALRLGVDNLLDRQYFYRGSYPLSGRVVPIPAAGRTVHASLTWKF